jgi:hypothetical protein
LKTYCLIGEKEVEDAILDLQIPNNKIHRISLPTSSDYKNIKEVSGKR